MLRKLSPTAALLAVTLSAGVADTRIVPNIAPPAMPTDPALFRGMPQAQASCARPFTREQGKRFAAIPDAPTAIDSARIVPAGGTHGVADDDPPEICRVEGVISPTVGFLPRDATRNLPGPKCAASGEGACGGVPVGTVMWIYEMHWRKTPDGWQIARNILRDDN